MTAIAIRTSPCGAREVTMDEMSGICGGTFDKNRYSKSTYHAVGISTSYHFFSCDEFRFMGKSISYEQANEIVSLGQRVYKIINLGQNGANQIGYGEPMFIRSFNSQLKLTYGFQWDGVPGSDF